MAQFDAAAALVLLEFDRSYGLGFVAQGKVVTCLHVVQGESSITAHLADGRALAVRALSALDTQRNLAVLDVGLVDLAGVRGAGDRLVDEGTPVHAFGMVSREGHARWVDGTVGGLQVLGSELSLYRLDGPLPPDASGGPVLGPDGSVLGVAMVTQVDDEVQVVALPWRYVAPLLNQSQELPLSVINRKAPRREVPTHPTSLLEGSALPGLEATQEALGDAIRRGAPLYNAGHADRCFQLYAEAAREVIAHRADCPGVQAALRAGLLRAEAQEEPEAQAWAMRDAFDGLLSVMERYFEERTPGRKAGRRPYLN